ncbi:acetylcholine receptor subunit alpha-like [Apostichopus japonicus]|uniref:acetylcholine receptor subunit alpha-like n=1 Tax=Stichopus japonicus TaxID=307972 RepID=UPI003AB601B4
MPYNFLFNCFVLLHILPNQAECASRDVLRELHKTLMAGYEPSLRPVNDTSKPVIVGYRFTPTISVLNEIEQHLQLRGMVALTWCDPQLTWQPENYEGINKTKLPLSSGSGEGLLWQPELVLNESIAPGPRSFQPETTSITLEYTGQVYWYTLANFESFCRISVRYYPFDEQICYLTFTTWLYQTGEQQFEKITDLIDQNAYKKYALKHGLWSLDIELVEVGANSYDCASCEGEEQSYIHYVLKLKRGQRSLHFMALILPCLVMSAMTTLALCLPRTPDPKAAAFSLSCILTLFVFLSFLFNKLPSTGQPVIGGYVVWLLVEGVVISSYVAISSRFAAKDQENPEWMRTVKWFLLGVKICSTFVYMTIFIVLIMIVR